MCIRDRDNTMNEVEEYFQYKVDIKPNMISGTNFITDVRTCLLYTSTSPRDRTRSRMTFSAWKKKRTDFLVENLLGPYRHVGQVMVKQDADR